MNRSEELTAASSGGVPRTCGDEPASSESVSVLFGGLTVAAVYRLRVKRPDRERPYRCWGYPLTPALYLAICLAFLVYVIQGDPQATVIGLLLTLSECRSV